MLTGCHDAAGTGSNPLSHTMDTGIDWMEMNGNRFSEAELNSFTAAALGVPVLAVTGDEGVCARMKALIPDVRTVAVNAGKGGSSLSIHPGVAVERIHQAVKGACLAPREDFALRLPERFTLDIRYVRHAAAYRGAFYPGMERLDSHTLRFETANWNEALRMMLFCL